MSEDKEVFPLYADAKNAAVRKRLGINGGYFWTKAKKLSVAISRCIAAMDDKGYDEDDFKKPVRVNLPDVNDLPPEGVFDTEFCNRYEKGGEDGITMVPIPGTTPAVTSDEKEDESTSATDNADAVTGYAADDTDSLPAYAYNVNGELMADIEKEMSQPVSGLALPLRYLAQCETDSVQHQITPERLRELHSLEMDPDSRTGSILLALQNRKAQLEKLDTKNLHSLASYIGKVFPKDKQPQLNDLINFIDAVFNTDYVDRGLLVKEWQKGNRVSCIQRTDTGTNAGGGIPTDRNPDLVHTLDTLDEEAACFLQPYDFNIYNIPVGVHRRAKSMIAGKESPWKEWSAVFRKTAGILDFSRGSIFAVIHNAPSGIHENPVKLLEYVNKNLVEIDFIPDDSSATDEERMEVVRRYLNPVKAENDEEKPQPTVELADESATPETVEPDATESHPNPQPLDAESSVKSDTPPREQFSEQLAADRGDFVPGISDPDDPKWVRDDYNVNASASNEGEKTENEDADDVNQNDDAVIQNTDSVNHSEPSADQIEPETPETDPKVLNVVPAPKPEWPTYFEYGRYEGVPNSAYHAADGISSSMLKDARISLMYFYGRYIAGTIKRETSDAFTMGSLVHSLVLEPAKFDEEYAVFPDIPAGAFTNTDSLKAFILEYNADKPESEQLKLTGKKEDLQEAIRAVKPDAIFADEYKQQWIENIGNRTVLTAEQLQLAKAMQQAVLSDSVAGYYVNHPSRSVEVSYFGMDEDTEMDVRVRPDLEITIDNERVGIDLKTISMGRVRQDLLRARLHREIIDRDYHISAAMYCDVANLDKFYWIFVNKDEGYHWVAVVEASREEIELGRLEYRKTMLALKKAYDSGVWPAPITEQYTDELNNYDQHRLEALREMA